MTFGKVIESLNIYKTLNPWLIIGIAGCVIIAWLLNRDLEQQPIRYTLYGIAFGITIKNVWNISFDIVLGILGIEALLLILSVLNQFEKEKYGK